MSKSYSIRDLASEFEVTTRTIRFYEEKGLLNPTRKASHRVYSSNDRTKLLLILRGKRLGFSLDESAEIILMYGTPANNKKQLERLIARLEEKRLELKYQQDDLEIMLSDLGDAQQKCQVALSELNARKPV